MRSHKSNKCDGERCLCQVSAVCVGHSLVLSRCRSERIVMEGIVWIRSTMILNHYLLNFRGSCTGPKTGYEVIKLQSLCWNVCNWCVFKWPWPDGRSGRNATCYLKLWRKTVESFFFFLSSIKNGLYRYKFRIILGCLTCYLNCKIYPLLLTWLTNYGKNIFVL